MEHPPIEFLVMSFGVTNAPAVFRALVNDVFRDMLNKFLFMNIEDILIFSESVQAFNAACAFGKSSHQRPTELLNSLPIPSQPWSRIDLDFITELPPSKRHTVIFTIVDCLSKAIHFVPLSKPLSS